MDEEEFENYPWGRVAFKNLMKPSKKQSYGSPGMSWMGLLRFYNDHFIMVERDFVYLKWDDDKENLLVDNLIKAM
ncbi:unnamed protein product [Microthlaspi erraticum]|uniref:DUF1985 domain-containing protein n=1 Tax=Microthlaspi erraticum TaxID=1685480 RepID=A0A6D2HLG6_9BRAS|nr:unnamed protein product [Microthlaspi erraticum]